MIRFDADLNSEIYKTVRNFNRKIKRLQLKGNKNLPNPISTRELKRNYQERGLLTKQLKLYKEFGQRDALAEVETSGGAKLSKWELDYLKANKNAAIKFYEREKDRIVDIDTEYRVLRNDYKNNLETKISILDRGLSESSPKLLSTQKEIITGFLKNVEHRRRGQNNWFTILERSAAFAGADKEVIKRLKDKMSRLDEHQFTDLYHTQGLIQRVFELQYEIEKGASDPDEIITLIDGLDETIDSMIETVQ